MSKNPSLMTSLLKCAIARYELIGHPALMERFTFRQGQDWTAAALPPGIPRGQPKMCFMNAFRLADSERGHLRYVEGYALAADLIDSEFMVHHAWCVDPQGKVVDNTWSKPGKSLYYGTLIADRDRWSTAHRTGVYGVLEDGIRVNSELIFRLDPELKTVFDEIRKKG